MLVVVFDIRIVSVVMYYTSIYNHRNTLFNTGGYCDYGDTNQHNQLGYIFLTTHRNIIRTWLTDFNRDTAMMIDVCRLL